MNKKHAELIYYNTWIIYLKRNKTIVRLPLQLFIAYRIHNTQGNDKVNTRRVFYKFIFGILLPVLAQYFKVSFFNETLKASVIIIRFPVFNLHYIKQIKQYNLYQRAENVNKGNINLLLYLNYLPEKKQNNYQITSTVIHNLPNTHPTRK